MRSLYTLTFALLTAAFAQAQVTIWSEDFGTGCNQGQLAGAYSGTNGSWTVVDATSGNNAANKFYVSATEAGMGAGNCGDGCLATGGTNATLHVGGVDVVFQNFVITEMDPGAAYNSGGISSFGFQSITDIKVESPAIAVSGYENLSLSFNYMEGGAMALDNATLLYHNGTSWSLLTDLAKTTVCGTGQGRWAAYTVALPAPTGPNIKVGFHWVNNDDGAGSDPSFAVDDIVVSGDVATGIHEASQAGDVRILNLNGALEVAFTDVDEEIMAVEGFDLLGQRAFSQVGSRSASATVDVSGIKGVVILQITTNSGMHTRKVVLQ